MNPWPRDFFRGIFAIALIGLLHQVSVVAQTETTQPNSDSEAAKNEAAKPLYRKDGPLKSKRHSKTSNTGNSESAK
jgi:hypothetical protein